MKIPDELYLQICRVMPIPCVDLLITDARGRVLLVKRKNQPAAGQWWFPGGRVHLKETREAAAVRKLKEECALDAASLRECGSYDLIFEAQTSSAVAHGITTLFLVQVDEDKVRIDSQSEDWAWRLPEQWVNTALHPFVSECIGRLSHVSPDGTAEVNAF